MQQYSISQLGKKFGLSRSSLLHYDAIGLLKSPLRTEANYRVYTEKDADRLAQICSLRSTGRSLASIRKIIDTDSTAVTEILQKRIDQINKEIKKLRVQQNVIVKLLGNNNLFQSTRIISKNSWVTLLESAGLDEQGMKKWHQEFERAMPEGHQDFLESLGLAQEEIRDIRTWAKKLS
jgi:DNA-binding transcriptional MerR regulator